MAAISGKKALVEYGGAVFVNNIDQWSLDVENDMLDTTSFTTAALQWRSFIAGLSQWSGGIGGNFDAASTAQNDLRTNTLTPTTAQIRLYFDSSGGANLRGSVLLRRASFGAEVSGKGTAGYDFQGTGTLTYSTTT